jgi:hypothetical protein
MDKKVNAAIGWLIIIAIGAWWLWPEPGPTPEEAAAAAVSKAEEDAACRTELQCWGEKHILAASSRCRSHIERLARFDFEWTNSWIEPGLSRFRWQDKAAGSLFYMGDSIKLQNGFGAWIRHIYTRIYPLTTSGILYYV